jgi:dethiobiotin synthetase
MTGRTFVITGTDTGVGKTVLTCLLAGHLRLAGLAVAALKPLGSGGREDARALQAALGGALTLDEVNPWHFRAPLAPALAARMERKQIQLPRVLQAVRRVRRRFQFVLVEGAGGLLSPLGEDFNARDLIVALRATPLIVCPNRLGAINQVLLVVHALPDGATRRARIVLMSPLEPDAASRSNVEMLGEALGPEHVHVLPWLDQAQRRSHAPLDARVRRTLQAMVE